MYKKLSILEDIPGFGCHMANVDWEGHSWVWTEYWLWTWYLISSVRPDTEVIQPSFCRSFDPSLCLCYVPSEVSISNSSDFLRVCVDRFETAPDLSFFSVVGWLCLCLLLVWFLDAETSVAYLSSMWNIASNAFVTPESLSCILMLLSCRQPRPIWRCILLSLLSQTNNNRSACFWRSLVSVGNFASSLCQLLAACSKP